MLTVELSCPLFDSFRVRQVAGMFDVPLGRRLSQRIEAETPEEGWKWRVGMIVGPSGSGKSSVAARLFGQCICQRRPWPHDRAVVDCLGQRPTRQIVRLLTAVGFGSPRQWIKPYRLLSNGEQHRCELARALAEAAPIRDSGFDLGHLPLVVFDEFTSVVDRTAARAVAAAVGKALRCGWLGCRFVAVTCHYDVIDWLAPEWVLDMATGHCQRRGLRRPPIRIELARCRRKLWAAFARYHYLSAGLPPGVRCYAGLWDGQPVCFCAVLPLVGRSGRWRISRLVTLPDYQGLGIGTAVMEAVARMYTVAGWRMNLTTSHPAMLAHCRRAACWRVVRVKKAGSSRAGARIRGYRGSMGRPVASFEYRRQ